MYSHGWFSTVEESSDTVSTKKIGKSFIVVQCPYSKSNMGESASPSLTIFLRRILHKLSQASHCLFPLNFIVMVLGAVIARARAHWISSSWFSVRLAPVRARTGDNRTLLWQKGYPTSEISIGCLQSAVCTTQGMATVSKDVIKKRIELVKRKYGSTHGYQITRELWIPDVRVHACTACSK